MVPPPKPPKTVKEARAAGLQPLTDFFRRNKNGRPKKTYQQGQVKTSTRKKKRGPVTGSKKPPTTGAATTTRKPPPKQVPSEALAKKKRTNWGKLEPLTRIEKALEEWDTKTGRALDENDEEVSLAVFSGTVEIPYHPLRKYVTSKNEARRKVGSSVGT